MRLSLLISFLTISECVSAFLLQSQFSSSYYSTALFYQDDYGRGDDNAPPNNNHQIKQQQRRADSLTIPVLGPIPEHKPLMIGSALVLDPPTPMQWYSLEETIHIHRRHQIDSYPSGIHAAPLVAVMDEYTAPGGGSPKKGFRGRYATIAAVVGMSASKTIGETGLDTSSDSGFMESVQSLGSRSPMDSRIRLLGIGRAELSDFYYQATHSDPAQATQRANGENDEDEDDDFGRSNIIMAQFRLLTDTPRRSSDFCRKDNRASYGSPVHALAEMSKLANKLNYLHLDRRRLVAGLTAAKARLQLAVASSEDLEDYDGLGMLFSRSDYFDEREESQPLIEQLLQDYPTPKPSPSRSSEEKAEPGLLDHLENYGLGYTSASFATLPDLTSVWLERLEPYYSPSIHSSEEHYYELLSFVAMQSMEHCLEPSDLGWALKCSNTVERLQRAYDWMWNHVRALHDEAERASQELRDCGEECTDLW